jgi:hypothetical protein
MCLMTWRHRLSLKSEREAFEYIELFSSLRRLYRYLDCQIRMKYDYEKYATNLTVRNSQGSSPCRTLYLFPNPLIAPNL